MKMSRHSRSGYYSEVYKKSHHPSLQSKYISRANIPCGWYPPTFASMPPNSSHPCASSPSASSHVEGDPPNDTPGPMDVAYWKRMYQALHQETNTLKKASKRKGE